MFSDAKRKVFKNRNFLYHQKNKLFKNYTPPTHTKQFFAIFKNQKPHTKNQKPTHHKKPIFKNHTTHQKHTKKPTLKNQLLTHYKPL